MQLRAGMPQTKLNGDPELTAIQYALWHKTNMSWKQTVTKNIKETFFLQLISLLLQAFTLEAGRSWQMTF
jgi:hypothetical protein